MHPIYKPQLMPRLRPHLSNATQCSQLKLSVIFIAGNLDIVSNIPGTGHGAWPGIEEARVAAYKLRL